MTKNSMLLLRGYLADNSPDLLLSVLACMDLTIDTATVAAAAGVAKRDNGVAKVIPAMINVRWTPREMERALHPTLGNDGCSNNNDLQHDHVTIVLYGLGYEHAAKEAVRLMNSSKNHGNNCGNNRYESSHFAVALALPELAGKWFTSSSNNDNNNASSRSSIMSGMKTNNNNHHNYSPSQTNNNVYASSNNTDALLLFTSGTSSPTGGAKGVRLSHQSLIVQAHAKTQQPCMYNEQTNVVATTVPWFHVGGMSSALAVILGGGCLVFSSF